MSEHDGNSWYKCDFHLHTMHSRCYKNQDDTLKMWMDRCVEQGLNAVAVTDHNDYRGITELMELGQQAGITVFPGVEITCDTSKIHMLIIFDTCEDADTVRDFLSRCDIGKNRVGDPDGTSMDIFSVCRIAKSRGAIVIAAHIDEFSSISSMNPSNLDQILSKEYIDAVQVANAAVWRKYAEDKDTEAMQNALRSHYGPDATSEETEKWRKCYERAKAKGIPMLSFSDNPASEDESKHGLWGIGSVYTWIQMDKNVDLESIRQSLLSPEGRIKMMIDSREEPRIEPDFWIKSLDIRNTSICSPQGLHFDFHPQLNCIIGRRGSGKSALVHILSGVYRQITSEILNESALKQRRFYSRQIENENRTALDDGGIFTDDSKIEIRFKWYGINYRLLVNSIYGQDEQKYSIYYKDPVTGEEKEEPFNENSLKSLMSARVFTQTQIYEISGSSDGVMELLDSLLPDMYMLRKKREYLEGRLVTAEMDINALRRVTEDSERINAEHIWLNSGDEFVDAVLEDEKIERLVTRRRAALAEIDRHNRELEAKKSERLELLKEYEEVLLNIRNTRTRYVNETLKYDENYKMELIPFGDRNSLRVKIRNILGDSAFIDQDLKKIEEMVYTKKIRPEVIADIFTALRSKGEKIPASEDTASKQAVICDNFSEYFSQLIKGLSEYEFIRLLTLRPEDELLVSYHPTGIKRFFPLNTASTGEKAAAILSLVLLGGSMPLVIDTPEENIDNRVICEEIIPKLKHAKANRQLIITTGNANIAMNSDAEKVIALSSGKKFMNIELQGSIDNAGIRREICNTLEGTEEDFERRARKYYAGRDL